MAPANERGTLRRRFFSLSEDTTVRFEEFKVTAPTWAKEGDSIEIEANSKRFVVCVPQGTPTGEQFTVAVPSIGRSVGEQAAELGCPARACCTCCSTMWLVAIWGVVGFNYIVHVLWREVRWNAASLVAAHAIIGLQVASFVRCQLTPPGTVSAEWQRQAAAGLEPSESCKRSGLLQPARGRFVAHDGKVVLGLDHYCFWLGQTIGLRNRKYFVLFLMYSCALSAFGGVHAAHELFVGLPGRLPAEIADLSQDGVWRKVIQGLGAPGGHMMPVPMQGLHGVPVLLMRIFVAASGGAAGAEIGYCLAVMLTCVVDLVATVLLGLFGGWHVYMVLRNRTTVEPDEKKYDVGLVANVRQVMGRDAALWLLPLEGAGPTVDGIHWPLNPRRFDLAAAAAEREVEVLANNSTTSSLAEAGVAEEVMAANKDRDA